MKQIKHLGPASKKVLLLLEAGLVLSLTRRPDHYFRILKKASKEWKKINERYLRETIKKLYQSKLIDYKENNDGTVMLTLSEKGKNKLHNFQNSFPLNKDLYKKKIGETVIVISYDIPIAFNRERNILRDMLRMLGFNLVHKSVWVGKVILPERFITDLNRLGIMDYVEILEVTKNGTLELKD